MDIDEKRRYAKEELGIKQASNMKEETLDKRIAEAAEEETGKVIIKISTAGIELLKWLDVPLNHVEAIAEANNWKKMEYVSLRKAFKCFEGDGFAGWLTIEQLVETTK